jgi:hypothetical protein
MAVGASRRRIYGGDGGECDVGHRMLRQEVMDGGGGGGKEDYGGTCGTTREGSRMLSRSIWKGLDHTHKAKMLTWPCRFS